MPVNDALGTRMKTYYEAIPKTRLMRRTPVAIRIDGKAFHTFTRGFQKPFDEILGNSMARTMEYLCQNIQGAVFGYTQSDEITILIQDYKKLTTDAWFDYEVQKMCSIAASMATMAFNRYFSEAIKNRNERYHLQNVSDENLYPMDDLGRAYAKSAQMGAMFDARVFNIPKEEAANLIYWRQVDAMRNSIQMVGQANYSHSYLQDKSCEEIKGMLRCDFGINWDGLPARWKYGAAWTKTAGLDFNMPIIKGGDRAYVENEVYCEEE